MKSKTISFFLNISRIYWACIFAVAILFPINEISSQCRGGQVFAGNGTDNISICPADAAAVGLDVYNNSNAATNYAYAVTDLNNSLLYTSTSSNLKFENLIEGKYFVYGFSYQGDIIANSGDFIYTTRFATGCWQISFTRVEVAIATPLVSEIRTADFQTKKNICLNEGAPDFVSYQNISTNNAPFVFLITDTEGRILEVSTKTFTDFSNAPFGDCKIYGLAYTGQLIANFGLNISDELASGCYQLSDNVIDVNRSQVNGGNVFTQDFISFYRFTTDDNQADLIELTNSGSAGAEYTYVLTDATNRIIRFLEEPRFDFEGIAEGVYRIWGFSFSGDIILASGQSIFGGPVSNGCSNLAFNAITVTTINEGIVVGPPACTLVSTEISALGETTLCQNSPVDAILIDAEMTVGPETKLLLVDQNNFIVQVEQVPEISTLSLAAGDYNVYQIVHEQITGLLTGQALDNIEGCFALSNAVPISILDDDDPACSEEEVCTLEASILSVDFDTVCTEDPEANTIVFSVANTGQEAEGILITDLNGIILTLSADRIFQITTVGIQVYYNINFVDTVHIFSGESIDDLEGCFTLSNAIEITGLNNCITEPCAIEPAQISTNSNVNICTEEDADDSIEITAIGGTGDEQVYLLIESGNPQIIASNSTGNFQIGDDMPGVFEIYRLDYTEPFSLGESIIEFEGCFDLSNSITVTNSIDNCLPDPSTCLNEGGQIAYNGPTGICGSDGQNDIIELETLEFGGNNRVFLVVNDLGRIIDIVPALVVLDNPFPNGNYNIYAMSYEDFPAAVMLNANLNEIENLCLSNSISILVSDDFCEGEGVRGGQVSDDSGQTDIKLCTNISGEIFTVNLENAGSEAFDYIYLETDENNIITDILGGASTMYIADPTARMNNRIWGVSFSGMFTAFVGEDITSVALSDDTFSVSDNFVAVEISVVIAEDPIIIGAKIPFVELQANQETVLALTPNMSAFLDYETAYILFDIDGQTILEVILPDDSFNITIPPLDTTPQTGELLQLTTIAYTGELLLEAGEQANSAFLPNATNVTTGCFEVASVNISIRVFDDKGGVVFPLDTEFNKPVGEEISLQPNPVKEIMQVTMPASFVGSKMGINIFDTAGRLVFKKNFNIAPTIELIDVTGFSNGTYILQAYTDFSARTIQFLKI